MLQHKLLVALFFIIMGSDYITLYASNEIVRVQTESLIYCPWRDAYQAVKDENDKKNATEHGYCPFCFQVNSGNDQKYLILRRFKYHFLLMNAYPMTKGHLLVIPYEHVAFPCELTEAARFELMQITTVSVEVVKEILQVKGVNIGYNLGPDSGASIPGHLHVHIVPRYANHPGFYEMAGKATIVSWDMRELYERLKESFQSLELE